MSDTPISEMASDKMSWINVNLRAARICAFCKYWWDPASRYVMPRNALWWTVDAAAKCRCMKKESETQAQASCGMFCYKNTFSELI